MSDWIDVAEQPLVVAEAIVLIPLVKGYYINFVSIGKEGDLYDVDGSYIGYHASQVTHWMPLPEPPKA